MADNVTLPGNGEVVATDQVGTAHYQFMKLKAAELGGERDLDQDLDAVAGATDPGIMAMGRRKDTAASLVGTDGDYTTFIFDSLGRLHVNVGNVVAVSQSGTWVLGANSGVDIGDVTINNASGASAVNVQDGGNSLTVDNSTLAVVGGGTEAAAMRVTIANDSTGVVSVDDNGGSLTVDGTVTANLAAGSNNIGDVDVLSIIPGTGATNLGKAEDAVHASGDVGVGILGIIEQTASNKAAHGDYGFPSLDFLGRQRVVIGNTTAGVTSGSITAVDQTVTAEPTDSGTAAAQTPYSTFIIKVSGTYAGVTLKFEVSADGGAYVNVPAVRSDFTIAELNSGVLPSNTTRYWILKFPGAAGVRVYSTTYTSGTANITIVPYTGDFVFPPWVNPGVSRTTILTNVSSSATSVTLLAANVLRKGAIIFNDSTQTLYLKLGATASTTSFSYLLVAGATFELPTFKDGIHTDVIDGIWASANGSARVTEIT